MGFGKAALASGRKVYPEVELTNIDEIHSGNGFNERTKYFLYSLAAHFYIYYYIQIIAVYPYISLCIYQVDSYKNRWYAVIEVIIK